MVMGFSEPKIVEGGSQLQKLEKWKKHCERKEERMGVGGEGEWGGGGGGKRERESLFP